ncbi:putative bifunctional inhibitor/plant lipid transfer protein/seed storage helical [Rosa chinensis]|uniref:Putative bifunctional inhibitor/plant lipid transfer protein/seed storage helical n=1 Tax=Rosa chinensis TaxID=74649 RepID=A0A2P6QEX3_ROSCH|nr:non-specific lipid transfer protein GPI-anchored 2 [Rosa chinensis]PRQ32735.1 putative bifunctional inhibitor/plant lipid transfer protein/seed storage helical [Rosa chinensis]
MAFSTNLLAAVFTAMLFMLTFHSCGVSAQAPGPAPEASVDCSTQLLTLSDCLTYVEEGSNLTKPDKACCPELAALVKSTPQCLCYLLQKNSTSSYGIQIDMNKALDLPSVCKVETPPTSACALLGIPVASEGPTANSPAGSELAPQGPSASPGNQTDHGTSTTAKSLMALFIGLAIASLPTFF